MPNSTKRATDVWQTDPYDRKVLLLKRYSGRGEETILPEKPKFKTLALLYLNFFLDHEYKLIK